MAEENALPRTASGQIVQPINMSAQSNQPTPVNIPQQQAQYIPSNPDLQTNAMLDMQIVQQISEKANTNNKLLEQINGLTTALFKGTLTPENQNSLTPQQLRAVQVGDMNSIAQQIGMVKWTMSARGQEVKDSIGYLLNGMQQIRQEQESKRIAARQNIMDALNIMGSGAFEGLSADEKRRLEKNSGLTNGYLDRATGALRETERKAEEARQLQMEQSRQSMRLQQEQFDFSKQQAAIDERFRQEQFDFSKQQAVIDERFRQEQFGFSKQQAAADERFRQQQFAFQQAEAGRARSERAAERAASVAAQPTPQQQALASLRDQLNTGKVGGRFVAITESARVQQEKGMINREQAIAALQRQYAGLIDPKVIETEVYDILIDPAELARRQKK